MPQSREHDLQRSHNVAPESDRDDNESHGTDDCGRLGLQGGLALSRCRDVLLARGA
jgi:hypothetical protein